MLYVSHGALLRCSAIWLKENKLARALYTSDIEPPISNMVAELVRIYGETPF